MVTQCLNAVLWLFHWLLVNLIQQGVWYLAGNFGQVFKFESSQFCFIAAQVHGTHAAISRLKTRPSVLYYKHCYCRKLRH